MGPFKSVPYFLFTLLTLPVFISGNGSRINPLPVYPEPKTVSPPSPKSLEAELAQEAASLYEEMELSKAGLSENAFRYAWTGYRRLVDAGQVYRKEVLSICDFSQSSRRKRLYVLDVASKKVLLQTYVAHGRNSGAEYARSFSNRPDSHKSSLGFFITRDTYIGGHGLALNIDGQERGINDRADDRKIVIHGSNYVSAQFLRHHKFIGRSLGCPAVPIKETRKIIATIRGGSCFFIFHPTKTYLAKSPILNS